MAAARVEIRARLGERPMVSLHGNRTVHAGIHRSGGGWIFGIAYLEGGIGRNQHACLLFVRGAAVPG